MTDGQALEVITQLISLIARLTEENIALRMEVMRRPSPPDLGPLAHHSV